ncbi:MAG: hypothetical protein OEY11_12755 [Gammaproteobacteria bacterium]|nr:hypothetical protein [Gammaproteobacteria bacterium]
MQAYSRFTAVFLSLLFVISLTACDIEIAVNQDDESVAYSIVASGTQSDIQEPQQHVIKNTTVLSGFISLIPSMTGDVPSPDFTSEMLVAVLSDLDGCGNLELTSVEENENAILVTLSKVFTADPGLCDLAPENINNKHYLVINIASSNKAVNVEYNSRHDYAIAQTDPAASQTELEQEILALYHEIDILIGDAHCNSNAQCDAVAIGARACGGPDGYKVYASLDTDVTLLLNKAQQHRERSEQYNTLFGAEDGLVSICLFESKPAVLCNTVCEVDNN